MQWLTQHDKEINHHMWKLQGQAMLKLQRTTSKIFIGIHDNFGSSTKLMCFQEWTRKQSVWDHSQYAELDLRLVFYGFMEVKLGFWAGLCV